MYFLLNFVIAACLYIILNVTFMNKWTEYSKDLMLITFDQSITSVAFFY